MATDSETNFIEKDVKLDAVTLTINNNNNNEIKTTNNRRSSTKSNAVSRVPFQRLRNLFNIIRFRLNNDPTILYNQQEKKKKTTSSSSSLSSTDSSLPTKKSKKNNKKNKSTKLKNKNKAENNINLLPVSITGDNNSTTTSKDDSKNGTCELCLATCPVISYQNDDNNDNDDNDTNFMYLLSNCEHLFCVDCLRLYLKYQITESRVSILCPKCTKRIDPSDIYELLSPKSNKKEEDVQNLKQHSPSSSISSSSSMTSLPGETTKLILETTTKDWSPLIDKYEQFMLRRVLITIPDTRWCPAPDCSFALIASGCANCPQLYCQRPGCNTSFCYHCRQYWHPAQTCEDAALANNQSLINGFISQSKNVHQLSDIDQLVAAAAAASSSSNKNKKKKNKLTFNNKSNHSTASLNTNNNNNNTNSLLLSLPSNELSLLNDEMKRCPKCDALIVKTDDGSCNHMSCALCGCEFCWLCMKEISDLHYLSPSGCTFWGKKPWSRKKKILWQLG
jgi:hypothetical protein